MYLVGGGAGSLTAAAFMIRDGSMPGANISIFETASVMDRRLAKVALLEAAIEPPRER
jgi:myosin-crossreactive antigen